MFCGRLRQRPSCCGENFRRDDGMDAEIQDGRRHRRRVEEDEIAEVGVESQQPAFRLVRQS